MDNKTKSEELFENFCISHCLPLFRCVSASEYEIQIADYLLAFNGHVLVIEVKQPDVSPQDETFLKNPVSDDSPAMCIEPGRRVRKMIDDAGPQLRQISHGILPAMLVAFDNTEVPLPKLQPHDILTGMYGLEQVVVGRSTQKTRKSVLVDHRFGPKQKVSPDHNTTIGAVGVLTLFSDDALQMDIYHNDYAANKISPDWFSFDGCRHWKRQPSERRDQYREWMGV